MLSCTVPHTTCYAAAMLSCTLSHTSCCAAAMFSCTFAHTSCYAAQFVVKKRVNNNTIHVHTGTIDNVWKMIKKRCHTFWKPKMPKSQTAWTKRFGSMFERGSGVGKTQIATTWASSRPPLTWNTWCEEQKARRCGFTQNDPKMGSQNLKKFLTAKHMNMT